jgi:hypothetical protein
VLLVERHQEESGQNEGKSPFWAKKPQLTQNMSQIQDKMYFHSLYCMRDQHRK